MDEEINLSDSTIGNALNVVKEISAVQSQARLSRGVAFGTPAVPQPLAPNFKPEVQKGDSLWSILNKILSNKINNLDKAGQIFVISTISDMVIKDSNKYSLKTGGSISVGDKLDFSSLFADEQRIKSILERAGKLQETQKNSIIENNKKISSWLSAHPDANITLGKVGEILAVKPAEIPKEIPKAEVPKPVPPIVPKPIPKAEMPSVMPPSNPKKIPLPVSVPIPTATPDTPAAAAVKSLMNDGKLAVSVDKAFKDEVESIYGKSGFLKKTPGVETSEWLFVKSLPAGKVMKYFTGDSANSGLSPKDAEELSKSTKHQELVKQLAGLMKETKEVVKPYENETVEQFLKRLGKYVMENHLT